MNLKKFLNKVKMQLRNILNAKRLVILSSVFALVFTIVFVKYLKLDSKKNEISQEDIFFEEALKNKKALTIVVETNEVSLDFIYPGVKVDLLNKSDGSDLNYIVQDVYVVGVNIIEEGAKAKVSLALTEEQSLKVLSVKGKIGFLIRGNEDKNKKSKEDIEIVEM